MQGLASGINTGGGSFEVSNTGNSKPALKATTAGAGPAGRFGVMNSSSGNIALLAFTQGLGEAAQFGINNSSNEEAAVHAFTSGAGQAGLFEVTSTSSSSPTILARHAGTGPAGQFTATVGGSTTAFLVESNSPSGGGSTIHAVANGDLATAGLFEAPILGLGLTASGTQGGGIFQVLAGVCNCYAIEAYGNPNFSPKRAARFFGDVRVEGNMVVTGTLTKPAGSFRIDHPLDPDHKYLSHSFVESPDMMNVYNGNATLDAKGRATVELPEYFEALNRDFRYQLTAIGAPRPNLYIAEGVQQNRFRIAGGRPYARVSWQVTGIRKDPYAEEHRIKVEEEKPQVQEERLARN